MSGDRITEYDPDLHPEEWKKCGACPTLIPVVDRSFPEWKAQTWHRTLNGVELCGECSEAVMDAEQEAAESQADARADYQEAMAAGSEP